MKRATFMKRLAAGVAVLVLAATSVASAQEAGTGRPRFDRQAIQQALSNIPFQQAQLDPRSNWAAVERLAGSTEIFISVDRGTAKKYRLVSADATGLTAVALEDAGRPTVRIARENVSEVRAYTGRRGSKLWAAIGAGAGAFAGAVTALNLAYKDCGGNCNDEKVLMGFSLVGFPVIGAVAGYYVPSVRTITTIYLKS